MLTRLIYASTATDPTPIDDLAALAERARARNEVRDVTGLLLSDGRAFLQVLEGDRRAVSDLYGRIVRDRRHRDLVLLECVPIEARTFADWHMGLALADASNRALFLRHGTHGRFAPDALAPRAALALLSALSVDPAPAHVPAA